MSVVVIHSPQDQHLGEYACEAANSLGKDSKIIQIEGKIYTKNIRLSYWKLKRSCTDLMET